MLILAVVLFVVVALIAIPTGIVYFSSQAQCGSGGVLVGGFSNGYCMYQSVCEDCQNATSCPDCSVLCESRQKTQRDGYCGLREIDLTQRIKQDSEGNIYIEEGAVTCSCCCDNT